MKRFASEHHINYPVVMATPEIEKLFPGIGALPTSFIIDRESRVVQKHVGMLRASTTEQETRALAGLPVNASIEEVDQTQGLKLALDNGAQAMTIPGVDLAALPVAEAHRGAAEVERAVVHLRLRPDRREMPRRRSDLRRQPAPRPPDRQADCRKTVSGVAS